MKYPKISTGYCYFVYAYNQNLIGIKPMLVTNFRSANEDKIIPIYTSYKTIYISYKTLLPVIFCNTVCFSYFYFYYLLFTSTLCNVCTLDNFHPGGEGHISKFRLAKSCFSGLTNFSGFCKISAVF